MQSPVKVFAEPVLDHLPRWPRPWVSAAFGDPGAVGKLARMYQASEVECRRNNKRTPEIGASRERDLVSYLKHTLVDCGYDIDNAVEADVRMGSEGVSIKHSSNPKARPGGIKVTWTANEARQDQFLETFEAFTCSLLIVYVRFTAGFRHCELECVYVHRDTLNTIPARPVFRALGGNSRGIEFSGGFFEYMLATCDFRARLYAMDVVDAGGVPTPVVDPIEARLRRLSLMDDPLRRQQEQHEQEQQQQQEDRGTARSARPDRTCARRLQLGDPGAPWP